MRLNRLVQLLYIVGVAIMLSACSGQASAPTAPSALNSAGPGSVPRGSATSAVTDTVTASSAGAPTPSASNFEVKFMTDMIDHHHMAVMMAELCTAKATHPQLPSLCEGIRSAQLAEIAQMQTWLQAWYSVLYEPVMKPGDENMMERLASLNDAEFEVAFMEMMIRHHEKAIKEGRACLDKGYHSELRSLCENIVRTQSAEIAQMQAWLCQWYGECR